MDKNPRWVSLIVAVCSAIVSKLIWEAISMDRLLWRWRAFVVDFWPMWFGLLLGLLCWGILDYIKLRRFNNYLKKWIGLFSYTDDKGSYNDLKGKIKRYVQEGLGGQDKSS